MSNKEKHNCEECIHKHVCEWAVYDTELYCDDFIFAHPLFQIPCGEWIKDKDTGLIGCSHCHIVWLRGETAYCPNCGAKMK